MAVRCQVLIFICPKVYTTETLHHNVASRSRRAETPSVGCDMAWRDLRRSGTMNDRTGMNSSFGAAVRNALRCRCPNCREGALFRNRLNGVLPSCPRCGLSYFRESGYYVGGMIITYVSTAVVLLIVYLISLLIPPVVTVPENIKFAAWVVFGVLLALLLVRPAYSLWITLDFWVDPWKPGDIKRR